MTACGPETQPSGFAWTVELARRNDEALQRQCRFGMWRMPGQSGTVRSALRPADPCRSADAAPILGSAASHASNGPGRTVSFEPQPRRGADRAVKADLGTERVLLAISMRGTWPPGKDLPVSCRGFRLGLICLTKLTAWPPQALISRVSGSCQRKRFSPCRCASPGRLVPPRPAAKGKRKDVLRRVDVGMGAMAAGHATEFHPSSAVATALVLRAALVACLARVLRRNQDQVRGLAVQHPLQRRPPRVADGAVHPGLLRHHRAGRRGGALRRAGHGLHVQPLDRDGSRLCRQPAAHGVVPVLPPVGDPAPHSRQVPLRPLVPPVGLALPGESSAGRGPACGLLTGAVLTGCDESKRPEPALPLGRFPHRSVRRPMMDHDQRQLQSVAVSLIRRRQEWRGSGPPLCIRDKSDRHATTADIWLVPERGIIGGLTVEAMGGRVCPWVAG